MYPYMNEDAAFERLKDIQREMENSRILAYGTSRAFGLTVLLAKRAWVLAGLAMRRAPRRRELATPASECEAA
jgi:hypothetical protein